jgi:hypothetical protein
MKLLLDSLWYAGIIVTSFLILSQFYAILTKGYVTISHSLGGSLVLHIEIVYASFVLVYSFYKVYEFMVKR